MSFEALLDEAMRLPAQLRGTLANHLLESLREVEDGNEGDENDPEAWATQWSAELRQRLANDDGQRFSLSETLAELRGNLARGR